MSRGMGRLYLRGEVWWLDLSIAGKKVRLSTGLRGGKPGRPPKDVELWRAQKLLEVGRTGGIGLAPVTFDEVAQGLVTRYTAEKRPSLYKARMAMRFMGEVFRGWKVREMTTDRMLSYAVKRRDQDGQAVASVNTEMGLWHRALVIAHESGRLAYFAKVPRLPGSNVRQGSIDTGPFVAILEHLPPQYQAPVRFLRLTGWRAREALRLKRSQNDRTNRELLLETSKTGQPRSLPYGSYPVLGDLLDEQEESAKAIQLTRGIIVPWIFHRLDGGEISYGALATAWASAREKAGFPTAILHDLRRTFVRNAERAGISRSSAMKITGHRSESVYRRYAIVERKDVQEALEKLAQTKESSTVVGGSKIFEKTS